MWYVELCSRKEIINLHFIQSHKFVEKSLFEYYEISQQDITQKRSILLQSLLIINELNVCSALSAPVLQDSDGAGD